MVELYWSQRESESDIAWNGYIDFSVVCLHWVAMSSDKDQREFSLSRSLQYKATLSPDMAVIILFRKSFSFPQQDSTSASPQEAYHRQRSGTRSLAWGGGGVVTLVLEVVASLSGLGSTSAPPPMQEHWTGLGGTSCPRPQIGRGTGSWTELGGSPKPLRQDLEQDQ